MCPSCGYDHGAYASCHATQERNWRADWASEARMYAPALEPVPAPAEPTAEPEPEAGDRGISAPELARRQAGAALVDALDVLSAALPRAVEMARTEERKAERAAVVAWLRASPTARMWQQAPMDDAADCIERGEHRHEEE